jgi:hypothetical protein
MTATAVLPWAPGRAHERSYRSIALFVTLHLWPSDSS